MRKCTRRTLLATHEKQTRGAAKRHRPTYVLHVLSLARLQALLSPIDLSLSDRHKLAEHGGHVPKVVMPEFEWVQASQLSKWKKADAVADLLEKRWGLV